MVGKVLVYYLPFWKWENTTCWSISVNIVYSGQWIQGARQRYRCRSRSFCTLFYFTANTIQVDNKRKQEERWFGEIKESKDTKKKKRNQKVKNALEGLDASDVGSEFRLHQWWDPNSQQTHFPFGRIHQEIPLPLHSCWSVLNRNCILRQHL